MSDLRNLPLSSLRALAAVGRCSSLSRAAALLGVTAGAIGHQIRHLETRFNVDLVERHGNQMELTARGRSMVRYLEEGFSALDLAVGELKLATKSRVFTIAADPSFSALWLAPRIPEISRPIPDWEIRLVNPGPQFTLDDRSIDLAISYRTPRGEGLAVAELFDESITVGCSPEWVGKLGAFNQRGAVDKLPLLHVDQSMGDNLYPSWADWYSVAGSSRSDLYRGPRFALTVMAVHAAVAGQGAVLASELLMRDYLKENRLVQIGKDGPHLALQRKAFFLNDPACSGEVRAVVRELQLLGC